MLSWKKIIYGIVENILLSSLDFLKKLYHNFKHKSIWFIFLSFSQTILKIFFFNRVKKNSLIWNAKKG